MMNEAIAHSCNILPGDFCIFLRQIDRQLLYRLANNFQIPMFGVDCKLMRSRPLVAPFGLPWSSPPRAPAAPVVRILKKRILTFRSIFTDTPDGIADVRQIDLRVLAHIAIASRRIRSLR